MRKIKNNIKSIPFKIRWGTRILGSGTNPNFLIIGAQKSGTTSLFNYINENANNFIPPKSKELYFFSERYSKGMPWYRAHFPFKIKESYLTGEATPDYLYYHKSAKRVYENYPNIKFIILLRNPVDRAYSQYNFQNNTNKTEAYDPRTFEEAIFEEIDKLNNGIPTSDSFNHNYKYYSYLARGLYAKQLKNWFEYFPREKFYIINSENFYSDTHFYLKEIFSFLGLKFRDDIELNLKPQNKSMYSEQMKKDTRKYLKSFFEPHNQELYSLLKHDFNWR